jgi:hypothetical protein
VDLKRFVDRPGPEGLDVARVGLVFESQVLRSGVFVSAHHAKLTAAAATQAAADAAAKAAADAAAAASASSAQWPQFPHHWPAQGDLLTWAQNMGALTAALLVLAGVVYLLYGVYAYRALVTLNAAVVGAYVGGLLGERAGNATAGAMVGGFAAAALAWPLMKYAVAIMGGIFGMLLGASVWRACGQDAQYAWSGGMMGLIFFGMLSFMLFRGSVMMYTSLQGSVMLVFGLLGLIYKYQEIAPKVTEHLTARAFILPLMIFVPATLGLIWQQTQYPGAPAAPAKK